MAKFVVNSKDFSFRSDENIKMKPFVYNYDIYNEED